ncbi:MAG: hypothetical protein AAF619_08845 [Pseudomonadota bacterium]
MRISIGAHVSRLTVGRFGGRLDRTVEDRRLAEVAAPPKPNKDREDGDDQSQS